MRRLTMLAGVIALAACGDGAGPVPGGLQVQLSGPTTKAVMLRVVGPQNGIAPAGGAQIRVEPDGVDTAIVILVAPSGSNLPSGTVATLAVSDVNALPRYTVTVLQAAAPAPAYTMLGAGLVSATVIR